LRFGGFPEIAAIENQTRKISYLKDILNSYIELDIKLLSDFAKADELYKLIRLLSTRVGQKTDFTKLANITGISIYNLKGFMQLLDYTYFIKIVPAFVRSIDREIAQQQKMYFADSGLLTVLGNTDRAALLENTLANALYNYGSVKYYAKKNGQEIDFILNESIAAEVKLTPGIHDKNTLRRRAESIDIQTHYIVGLELPDSEYSDFVWAGTL
jgi:predicted AAA+ superfamily ATPase